MISLEKYNPNNTIHNPTRWQYQHGNKRWIIIDWLLDEINYIVLNISNLLTYKHNNKVSCWQDICKTDSKQACVWKSLLHYFLYNILLQKIWNVLLQKDLIHCMCQFPWKWGEGALGHINRPYQIIKSN